MTRASDLCWELGVRTVGLGDLDDWWRLVTTIETLWRVVEIVENVEIHSGARGEGGPKG